MKTGKTLITERISSMYVIVISIKKKKCTIGIVLPTTTYNMIVYSQWFFYSAAHIRIHCLLFYRRQPMFYYFKTFKLVWNNSARNWKRNHYLPRTKKKHGVVQLMRNYSFQNLQNYVMNVALLIQFQFLEKGKRKTAKNYNF